MNFKLDRNASCSFLLGGLLFVSMLNHTKLNAQSNPDKFSDTLITHVLDRKLVNFHYLDSVMQIGFSQIKSGKNSINALIGSMNIKKLDVPGLKKTDYGEIVDTTQYYYQLQAIGYKIIPPSYRQQPIAFGGFCDIELSDNILEFNFNIEPTQTTFFYGYFDEQGNLFLISSFHKLGLERLKSKGLNWIKYRPNMFK